MFPNCLVIHQKLVTGQHTPSPRILSLFIPHCDGSIQPGPQKHIQQPDSLLLWQGPGNFFFIVNLSPISSWCNFLLSSVFCCHLWCVQTVTCSRFTCLATVLVLFSPRSTGCEKRWHACTFRLRVSPNVTCPNDGVSCLVDMHVTNVIIFSHQLPRRPNGTDGIICGRQGPSRNSHLSRLSHFHFQRCHC